MEIKSLLKDFFMITLGTAIIAASVYFFMLPTNLAIGSASALAMVISTIIPLPVSAITLILNVVLLIIGFILIGPEFSIKTIYASILLPGVIRICELLAPGNASITGDPFQDMICHILLVGVGLALLFSVNASSGGLDIISKLLNKYLHMEMGKAMALPGMLVALSASFCYDLKTVVISLVGTYLGGIAIDHFIFGMNPRHRVCIISEKYEEVVQWILHDLDAGATIYEGVGAYDGRTRKEIISIVDNQKYKRLMDYMKKADPSAFISVYSVKEVLHIHKKTTH